MFKLGSFGLPNTEKAGSFWKIPWAALPALPPPTLDSAKRWGYPGLVVLATSLPITYILDHLNSRLHDSNSEELGFQSQAARGSDCDNYLTPQRLTVYLQNAEDKCTSHVRGTLRI